MYAVEVRDHIMIAHSLSGAVFGPAQQLHGATYVVDVAFFRAELDPDNIVVDIGRAGDTLKAILKPLSYVNLDDVPELAGQVTTTEFMCRHIFDAMAAAISKGQLGPHASGLDRLRVTLGETHLARAWYEASLGK
jgi:6-pyruvoyl-tetrahydropterin synthase